MVLGPEAEAVNGHWIPRPSSPSSGNRGLDQPIPIERALHPHLLSDVGGGELHAHQLAPFDVDGMLAGEAAA